MKTNKELYQDIVKFERSLGKRLDKTELTSMDKRIIKSGINEIRNEYADQNEWEIYDEQGEPEEPTDITRDPIYDEDNEE